MIKPTFHHALMYLFASYPVVLLSVGFITALVTFITFLTLVKRWGDGY
jgi:hypothetical protein